jgi:hypothetical protein
VGVILDVDLSVVVPADQDQGLDRDDLASLQLFDGVPVLLGRRRIVVRRDVEVEWCIVRHVRSPSLRC